MQTNPVKAIREHCVDCCGGSSNEVKLRTVEKCALFPFRFGKNPYRTKREFTYEQKAIMRERMQAAREAKNAD